MAPKKIEYISYRLTELVVLQSVGSSTQFHFGLVVPTTSAKSHIPKAGNERLTIM